MDSFKGSVSGSEAADAVARGVKTVLPDAEISAFSVSDGGEGLTSSLLSVLGGTTKTVRVHDALGRSIDAEYGVIHDCAFVDGADLAVIELASASGLAGLKPEERDPEKASSKGSGELILAAIKDGYRNFLIGLGGTATNDCGLGMLRALGFSFTDTDGKETCDGAAGLDGITDISDVKVISELNECKFFVSADVNNPLYGEKGCTRVFSPQKGGTKETIEKEERTITAFAATVKRYYPLADENESGAGAAGGFGYAFSTFLHAKMLPGAKTFLEIIGFDEIVENADLVITGEGRMDGQSAMGKIPVGVAAVAGKYSVPVVALVGCVGDGAGKCNDCGITAFFPVLGTPCTLEQALDVKTASDNIARTAEQLVRVIERFKAQ